MQIYRNFIFSLPGECIFYLFFSIHDSLTLDTFTLTSRVGAPLPALEPGLDVLGVAAVTARGATHHHTTDEDIAHRAASTGIRPLFLLDV